jgi:imidazolonepropionase-like amidohydrolase
VGSIEAGKDADLVIYDKFPQVGARPAKQAEKQKLIDNERDKEKQQRAPQGAPGRRVGQ